MRLDHLLSKEHLHQRERWWRVCVLGRVCRAWVAHGIVELLDERMLGDRWWCVSTAPVECGKRHRGSSGGGVVGTLLGPEATHGLCVGLGLVRGSLVVIPAVVCGAGVTERGNLLVGV